jgi:hypothetical protein
MLIQSGASVKEAQELARHRDPKLTMNVYTKLGIHDLAAAMESMPAHEREPIANHRQRATGTCGKTEKIGSIYGSEGERNPTQRAETGGAPLSEQEHDSRSAHKKTPIKQGVLGSSPGWTRTNNQVINSHLLYH